MIRLTRPSTGDLIAGFSVALVAIPQSLAYAELAGLPAQLGLFASALPSLLAALFVSSRYLQTGPVALTALLTFGALSTLAEPMSAEYISLAALLALLVGLLRIALGLLRLGGLAYLLSEPVLIGFTTGAAILILSSQLPRVFDVEPGGDGVLLDAVAALSEPAAWQWQAMLFAAGALVAMFGGRRLNPLFPGVLLAVVAGVTLSTSLNYGGSVVGELSGEFIVPSFDFAWSSIDDLALPAIAIALVGFAEPSSIARTFAAADGQAWNADREMVSQGVANLAAAISGAFPVGGSFSRSSLNRVAGATSPWAGAITGLVVLLALPLTPMLERLPRAILGAIVVGAIIKLINIRGLISIAKSSRIQAVVGVGTLVATLASAPHVERGVLIGIVLAVLAHLYRERTVTVWTDRAGPIATIHPRGVLWFGTVPIMDRVLRAEIDNHADATEIEIDVSGIGRLDYTAAVALQRLVSEIKAGGRTATITGLDPALAHSAPSVLD